MSAFYIDIQIPYQPKGDLCLACNRIMENTKAPWTLILDHDVYLCNPFWYEICLSAVKKVGYKAGWITCVTNRIDNGKQIAKDVDRESEDLSYHITIGAKLWKKYGMEMREVKGNLSGFFILTHREAWKAVGGFQRKERKSRITEVDTPYSIGIGKAGYKKYVMPGLYIFHYHKIKKKGLISSYGREPFGKK